MSDRAEFEEWILRAPKGERFVYHRGDLARFRAELAIKKSKKGKPTKAEADETAKADTAWAFYGAGRLLLMQKRAPGVNGGFDYIAEKVG